jgi:hypothetical protein
MAEAEMNDSLLKPLDRIPEPIRLHFGLVLMAVGEGEEFQFYGWIPAMAPPGTDHAYLEETIYPGERQWA